MKSAKGSSLLDVADLLLSTKTKELNEKDSQTLKESHTLWNFRDTNFLGTYYFDDASVAILFFIPFFLF